MTSRATTLRLGTRRSPLALCQAHMVRDAIARMEPRLDVQLVEIVSDGDADERDLRDIGERGIFASALERQLADGDIDCAVHSSKDLTLDAGDALTLAAWLPRADPRDALVGAGCSLLELPHGARVATGSARRGAALRTLREDLDPVPIRGNVATRIERARERGDAGVLLAMAGLARLGLLDAANELDVRALAVDEFVPEAGQGAVVVQTRTQVCERTGFDWTLLDDLDTRRAVQLERELARWLGGGCERPVGVHCELARGRVHAFWAEAPMRAGRIVTIELVELELATLVSVRAPRDVDDAAAWSARKIAPSLAERLGAPLAQVRS